MIQSFRHKGLRQLYEDNQPRLVRPDLVRKIRRVLAFLDRAKGPGDMSIPGYRLHPLKGDLQGFWSVSVGANWRITFRFEGNDPCEVDLVDYH